MSDSGDLFVRKTASFANSLVKTDDEVITADHLNAVADRCIALSSADPARAQQIRDVIGNAWKTLWADTAKAQPLTKEAFAKTLKNSDKQQATDVAKATAAMLFDLIDTNKDDLIGEEEYAVFHQLMGLNPKAASEAFNAVDTNQDGQLSRAEFTAACVDFATSDDENSPFQHLLGLTL